MLLSWRKRFVIGLYPNRVEIRETRRAWRTQSNTPVSLAVTPQIGESPWQAPLTVLGQWLKNGKHGPVDVCIIVSDSFVRYAQIPWSGDVNNPTEMAALCRIHFETCFGALAADWEIQADMRQYGEAGLGCALDKELIQTLRELCASHSARLMSLQPYFMQVFNRWRSRITANALLAVIESGHCVLACCKDGAWHSIRTIRLKSSMETELPSSIDREILLQGLDDRTAIYLHCSESHDTAWIRHFPRMTLLDSSAFDKGANAAVAITTGRTP